MSSTGINKDKWESFSPMAQKVIEEVASEVPNHCAELLDPMVDDVIAKIKEAGKTEAIIMSDEETARLRYGIRSPGRSGGTGSRLPRTAISSLG